MGSEHRHQSSPLSARQRALLAQRIKRGLAATAQGMAVTVIPRRPAGPAPLSYAQQRFWLLAQLEPGSPQYHIPAAVRLTGTLHTDALRQVLNTIVRRHEVLRTSFPVQEGKPVQEIMEHLELALPLTDLTEVSDQALQEHMATLVQMPFDLACGPLWRASLLRRGAQEHVLVLCFHHSIFDGWSIRVLVHELGSLYTAYVAGETSPLAELPLQYADYAVWQRTWLEDGELERQLAYWRSRLVGLPPLLALPTDRPRPAVQHYRGARLRFTIGAAVTTRLHALGQRCGATLFMGLLGAFAVVLARYSGQTDLVIGTPVANRQPVETEGLIGCFVNTVVLRIDLGGDPLFTVVLERVREAVLGAQMHQEVPFERVMEAVQPERGASHTPMFQVLFALQHMPGQRLEVGELRLEEVEAETESAQVDVALEVREEAEGLAATLEYNTDVFDQARMQRLAGHYCRVLEGIGAHPEARISQLPLLTAAEEQRLLQAWNATQVEYPAQTVVRLFDQLAQRLPDAVAVGCGGVTLSYSALQSRARTLAAELRSQGVGAETLVGLYAERSLAGVIGWLGILYAGGACLPLDPSHPPERQRWIVADATPALLLGQRGLGDVWDAYATVYLDLDEELAPPAPGGEEVDDVGQLAYVLYTSGSTGIPKGVAIEHRSLLNRVQWGIDYFRLGPQSVVLQRTRWSFDVGVWEIFGALCSGARLEIVDETVAADPSALIDCMHAAAVTHLEVVPSLLEILVAQPGWEACRSLRSVACGGEVLRPALLHSFQAGSQARLYNLYGPTETAVDACVWDCSQALEELATVPIGCPIANTRIYLLDPALNPVPPGVPGEIYIGGVGVGRGYYQQPALTAQAFLSDPYAAVGARMYRTGDLGRYREDGTIEYLGRRDHQVKLRGFRVELGEIEAVLGTHPEVRGCVVAVREDRPGLQQLVAYVVPQTPLDGRAVRRYLQERLPEYMVPHVYVALEALPVNANGKVERHALPAPENRRQGTQDSGAPGSEVEATLARIWAEVLGLERVGTEDNFFTLGGDSILVIQVVSRARAAGLALTPRQLFQYQTIATLAQIAGTGISVRAEQGRVSGAVSLTPIQRWFFEFDPPTPQHWNQALLLMGLVALDASTLRRAVEALRVHHDALRMRFVRTAAGWQQTCLAEDTIEVFQQVNLSDVADRELAEVVEAECSRWQASLDLAHGPLLRVVLFDLGMGRPQRLLIAVHHLVIDGVSWRILLEDLQSAYRQFARGETLRLPAKSTAFKEWASRLLAYAGAPALAEEARYWRDIAWETLPPLPVDMPAGENTVASAETITTVLSEERTRLLLQRVQPVYRTNIQELLVTALAQCLCRWIGDDLVMIDIEGHGREDLWEDVDLSRTVGWFTSLFPVLLRLDAAASPGIAIKSVKEQLRRVSKHGLAFGVLRYLSSDPALVQAHAGLVFNYLGQVDQALPSEALFEVAEESSGACHAPQACRSHEFEVTAEVARGCLRVGWTYSRNRYRHRTIAWLAHSYLDALEALIEHCLAPEAGGYTPADFPLAGLDQEQLDEHFGRRPGIDDVYPLTPLQRGILFHSLYAPEAGAYLTQFRCTLNGVLDYQAFHQAWSQVMAEHPVLRTTFLWVGLSQPLQVVHREAELPVMVDDWRGLDATELERRWQELVEADLHRPFDLGQVPLLRLVLVRIAAERHYFLWTCHHLLLDGWSASTVLQEVFAAYDAGGQRRHAQRQSMRPFRDYLAWLQSQEYGQAEAYWRPTLADVRAATPLVIDRHQPIRQDDSARQYAKQVVELAPSCTMELQALVQHYQLTLNTVVQGAWAIVLSRYNQMACEVLFGITVAGRPAELVGVEAIVGMFINTLPLRVRLSATTTVVDFLRQLLAQNVEMRQFEYLSLVELQGWSRVPRGQPLFESLLIFENYPVDRSLNEQSGAVRVTEIAAQDWTHYPLTLTAIPGEQLTLMVEYDRSRFTDAVITRLLGHLEVVLTGMAADPSQCLAALPLLADVERTQVLEEWNAAAEPSVQLDGKALPEGDGMVAAGYVRPRTEIEVILCGLWAEVLGLERVGVYDNFFELGGHSLLAMQLVARIRQAFEMELPLRAVFESPRVSALAEVIAVARRGAAVTAPPLVRVPREGALPLSYAQQRLWFWDQLEPGNAFYNIALALRIYGALNVGILRQALDAVVQRHEVLRTTFEVIAGQPIQVIASELRLEWPVVSLLALPEAQRPAEVERWLKEEAMRSFDLARGPLIRVGLLVVGADEHVLLLSVHHSVADGWSMDILLDEWASFYGAYVAGRESPCAALPIQYGDYAVWQRRWLEGGELERQLGYWQVQLAGLPEVVTLPTDRVRPAVQRYVGARCRFTVGAEIIAGLRALGRRCGATLFMVLLAAFKVLLARYSGQHDLVVGTPLAHRPRVETESLIGCFVNTVVMRTNVGGDPIFTEVLGRVRETVLGAQAHQDVPFERVVEAVRPAREVSHTPLFQVMFALQNTPRRQVEVAGVRLEGLEVETGSAQCDVVLEVWEEEGRIEATLEYNTDMFDRARMERLAGHYGHVLAGIVARPEARVSQFPLLTVAEEHCLLRDWNATQVAYPAQTVVQLFAQQARRTPDAVAVLCAGEALSYGALQARAGALAAKLCARGVGAEIVVGLYAERSIAGVIGWLGILQAGGACLPIDPSQPVVRQQSILTEAAPALLLMQRGLGLVSAAYTDVCVDLDEACGLSTPVEEVDDVGQLAYVLYTSGSTGTPKGVAIEHRSLLNRVQWGIDYFSLGPQSVVLQRARWSFDVGVWEIFGALCSGARLVIVDEAEAADPHALLACIDKATTTYIEVVPHLLEALVAQPAWRACRSLRSVSCGGEVMSRELLRDFQASSGARLYNLYGPTETTVDACVWDCSQAREELTTVPVGRPIANTRIYLLDEDLHPVPIGVPGEIYIGGVGVGRGYLNQPALTASSFLPEPYAESGARMYRTGDLGRYREDGTIEYLGRRDHQVKLRGLRIELGEIEVVLGTHPAVRSCVVAVREDRPGWPQLVAYVVTKTCLEEMGLRQYVRERLPEYMLPHVYMEMAALPVTPNGKLDRQALPAPTQSDRSHDEVAVTPHNHIEALICGIFAEVLELPSVGRNDNFFHLGGHSLLAVQVVHRLRASLGTPLSLLQLFQTPTAAHLAASIAVASGDAWQAPQHLGGRSGHPVLYLLPTGVGHVHGYTPIVSALQSTCDLYGFQLRSVYEPELPPLTMRELTEELTNAIQAHTPQGPYRLLGWSLGGWMAMAIAARLEQLGAQVAFLGLLDVDGPQAQSDWRERFAAYLHLPEEQERLRNLTGPEVEQLQHELVTLPQELHTAHIALWGQGRGYWFNTVAPELLQLETLFWRHTEALEESFTPPRLQTDIHVWWAAETLARCNGRAPADWRCSTSGRVFEVMVPGNHETLVQQAELHQSLRRILL